MFNQAYQKNAQTYPWTAYIRTEKFLKKKSLSQVKFEDMKDKSFDLILVVEMLCEVCGKPLSTKEKFLRRTEILSKEDYQNLLNRATVHDRVEVENGKIYFYDHDFPGDVHLECVEKL